jgi:hypothetical protein
MLKHADKKILGASNLDAFLAELGPFLLGVTVLKQILTSRIDRA